jgi:hypothetical protein
MCLDESVCSTVRTRIDMFFNPRSQNGCFYESSRGEVCKPAALIHVVAS